MNVFYTHDNPHKAANEHCDVHQVKMILEYSQLLSTAHHKLGTSHRPNLLAKTHEDHPSAVWVRESVDHYVWLFNCLMQLHKLYSDRTCKEHALYKLARNTLKYPPELLACNGFTRPPVAAPDAFKRMDDVCLAYQAYLNDKFDEWLSRDKPMRLTYTCKRPRWLHDHLRNSST